MTSPIDNTLRNAFAGKVIFITGGGSGINLAIGKTFVRMGARIGICGRNPDRLEAARAELQGEETSTPNPQEQPPPHVFTQAADVRDPEALQSALEDCRTALGTIDVLICGAAGNFPSPAEALSPNGFKSVIDIDLLGTFNAARLAFPQLQESRGNLIFISAGQSLIPYPLQAHVGAAKAGVDRLMQNLALEWGRYGIRCNSIVPGPVEGTEGVERLIPPTVRPALARQIPLGRLGRGEDIGQAAAWLASPLASYVTGTTLVVDGGMNLGGAGALADLFTPPRPT